MACLNKATIISQGGQVVNNLDGTVSVYRFDQNNVLAPVILTQQCCSILDSSYTWDANTQSCKYQSTPTCDIENVFKIVLNPQGNDGTIFDFGTNKDCVLDVEFDYLFKIKCETLNSLLINGANTDYASINPELALQIINQQLSIETQTAELEALLNEFNLLQEQYQATPFSITCASPDIVSPSVTYCLQQSEGLIAWNTIIGVNYSSFLNGESNSYTCEDVYAMVELNQIAISNGNPPLIVECDTPFGARQELRNQLQPLESQLSQFDLKLQGSINQLALLQETLNTERSNSCIRPIDMFESLDLSMTVDVLSGTTYETVYETTDFFPSIGYGLLYDYLTNNENSGFYVCGGSDCTPMYLNVQGIPQTNTTTCDAVVASLLDSLFTESNLSGTTDANATFNSSLSNSAFTSTWLHYQTTIDDQSILSALTDNKIRISIKMNHTCADICILLDNIKLNKVCTSVKETNIFVTSSPGFELDRIRDNKKSWVKNTSLVNRDFEILNAKSVNPIRQTNYNVEDERLVINTKEIDLDISLASAIVTDVWCYIADNPCLLTGVTYCDPCTTICCGDNQIDFNNLLTQPLSAITVVEDFEYYLTSELIDAKNRQTISGYPTLRALYDRYMNSYQYCGINSSEFDYMNMDQFAGLVGNYWVDIIEQVVPSTTIWGSVKIYSNTIFDQQKFRYKSYTSLLCDNKFNGILVPSPISATTGQFQIVDVNTVTLNLPTTANTNVTISNSTNCDRIYISQMNSGSEFIGRVSILGDGGPCDDPDVIKECVLKVEVIVNGLTATTNVIGSNGNVFYLWSNGDTGSTTTFLDYGDYTVTVTDETCCSSTTEFTVPKLVACWYSLPDTVGWLQNGFTTFSVDEYIYYLSSMIVNGVERVPTTPPSYTLTQSNLDVFTSTYCDSYTNFVTFLNQAFTDIGLTSYKAQISLLNSENPSGSIRYAGFYIIRPETDTFNMYISEIGNLDSIYSESGIVNNTYERGSTCENIIVVNGEVSE